VLFLLRPLLFVLCPSESCAAESLIAQLFTVAKSIVTTVFFFGFF
jgi:hypothetical protein